MDGIDESLAAKWECLFEHEKCIWNEDFNLEEMKMTSSNNMTLQLIQVLNLKVMQVVIDNQFGFGLIEVKFFKLALSGSF